MHFITSIDHLTPTKKVVRKYSSHNHDLSPTAITIALNITARRFTKFQSYGISFQLKHNNYHKHSFPKESLFLINWWADRLCHIVDCMKHYWKSYEVFGLETKTPYRSIQTPLIINKKQTKKKSLFLIPTDNDNAV